MGGTLIARNATTWNGSEPQALNTKKQVLLPS
jgi:hypothetical protein